MYLLTISLPLISSIFASHKSLGNFYGPIFSISLSFFAMISAIFTFIEVSLASAPISLNLTPWIFTPNLLIHFSFLFDPLTTSMFLPVFIISFLVQLYSFGYFQGDPHINRFFSYLSFFTFTMVILISADNFLLVFFGWEGVGLASYLLINFWFTRLPANFAALKAMFMNKFGDWAFVIAMILLVYSIHDLSFSLLFSLAHWIHPSLLFFILLFFFIASAAKSVQLGLHTWLANSMEGPTPVSALIHSATMVAVGVYFLIRLSPLLVWSSSISTLIVWIGALTALFGGSAGLIASDIKKIIAFSTSSQLGYMVVACGLLQFDLALFHLLNHAFFKSLLFLCSGSIIHALLDEQDIRKYGSLILYLPITYSVFLLASLSLIAFPFFSGFFSKDLLLELLLLPHNTLHSIAFLFTFLAALFTSIYSLRLLLLTFLAKPLFHPSNSHISDPHFSLLIPLILLSIAALLFGFLTQFLFLNFPSPFFSQAIFSHLSFILLPSLSLPLSLKLIPLSLLLLFFLLFPSTSSFPSHTSSPFSFPFTSHTSPLSSHPNPVIPLLSFLNLFDIIYGRFMAFYLSISYHLLHFFDRGFLLFAGPTQFIHLSQFLSYKSLIPATHYLPHYSSYI